MTPSKLAVLQALWRERRTGKVDGIRSRRVKLYLAWSISGVAALGALPIEVAQAAAPAVISQSVSRLGSSSATVVAELNAEGVDTHYRVEYGPTESYGDEEPGAPGGDLGEATEPTAASVSIGGLSPEAVYHFRFVAENAAHEVAEGPDQEFRTFAVGPVGLPDQRGYEQVSPTVKKGAAAGANNEGEATYAVSSPSGDTMLFGGTGPLGATSSGIDQFSVSLRKEGVWSTSAAHSRPQVPGLLSFQSYSEAGITDSADLSRLAFRFTGPFFVGQPGPETAGQYLTNTDGEGKVDWTNEASIPNPLPAQGANGATSEDITPVGGSSDFSTFYFSFSGLLVPEDEARRPNVGSGVGLESKVWGFYEWDEATHELRSAGVLPKGEVSPYGAVPARFRGEESPFSKSVTPSSGAGDIAEEGKQAYFLSPDPAAITSGLTSGPTELYLHRSGQPSVLVSHLANGAEAPDGPVEVSYPSLEHELENSRGSFGGATYVFAAPDGGRAFFESVDALTGDAPVGGEPKMYKFEPASGAITYLPDVQGAIVASSEDGSRVLFDDPASESLDLWTEAPGGKGEVRTVVSGVPASAEVPAARATKDGSVFAFETNAPVAGANSGGFEQVYRYDAEAGGAPDCVSCPPAGLTPSGDAVMARFANRFYYLTASRGMNSTGSEVFFDTPDPLVAGDTNGKRDVYEWEGGRDYLISSGTGPANSYFDDNSESGEDVFFATSDGLSPGDTDGGYDIYDAHVGAGGTKTVGGAACEAECQGPVPPALSAAPVFPSASLSGPGNIAAPVAAPAAKKPVKKKTVKKAKKKTKKKAKAKKKAKKAVSGKSGKRSAVTGGARKSSAARGGQK